MIIAVSIGGIDWMKEGETSANILVGPNYSLLCCVFDEHPPPPPPPREDYLLCNK